MQMKKTMKTRFETVAVLAAVCVVLPCAHALAQEAGEAEAKAAAPISPDKVVLGGAKIDDAAIERAQDPEMAAYRSAVAARAAKRDENMARVNEKISQIAKRKAEIVKEDEEAGALAESIEKLSAELEEKTIALEKIYGEDEKLNGLQRGLDAARADMAASQRAVRDEIRRQHAERRLVAQRVAAREAEEEKQGEAGANE